jgi:hypothetical protein
MCGPEALFSTSYEKEEAANWATVVQGEMKRKDFVIGQLKTHISNLTNDNKSRKSTVQF